jgi:AraC family transcriptional regulator
MPQLHLRDPQLEHIGWALKAELEAEAPLGRVYADSLGLAAATLLLRRYAPIAPARIAGVLSKRRLQRVIDYIHDHLAQELSLTELAQIANVSASHFKQLFKESTGMPVHQYIIRRRVEYAIDLILRADLPLSEVALQAGFANQSHMASSMRRVTGITPSALRRGSM